MGFGSRALDPTCVSHHILHCHKYDETIRKLVYTVPSVQQHGDYESVADNNWDLFVSGGTDSDRQKLHVNYSNRILQMERLDLVGDVGLFAHFSGSEPASIPARNECGKKSTKCNPARIAFIAAHKQQWFVALFDLLHSIGRWFMAIVLLLRYFRQLRQLLMLLSLLLLWSAGQSPPPPYIVSADVIAFSKY